MKTANLVIAIIYTVILSMLLLAALSVADTELLIGTMFFLPPVIMNWLSWGKYDK
jgi:hypothetical protein